MIYVEAMSSRRLLMSYPPHRRKMVDASPVRPAAWTVMIGPPGLEFALIEFGFMLRDACSYEGTEEPGDPCPGRRVGEDDAQGSRRDGGTYDGDHPRQDAEAGEGTEAQAGQGPGQGTRRGMRIVLRGLRHHPRLRRVA